MAKALPAESLVRNVFLLTFFGILVEIVVMAILPRS
jgi:hypothetical protein